MYTCPLLFLLYLLSSPALLWSKISTWNWPFLPPCLDLHRVADGAGEDPDAGGRSDQHLWVCAHHFGARRSGRSSARPRGHAHSGSARLRRVLRLIRAHRQVEDHRDDIYVEEGQGSGVVYGALSDWWPFAQYSAAKNLKRSNQISQAQPPLLVQRCIGTTARLGLLEVRWVAHAKIPHRAVSLWPHYQAVGYEQSEW